MSLLSRAVLCVAVAGCASSSQDDSASADASAEFSCNDDGLITGDPGGNDSLADATPTQVGDGAVVFSAAALSVCPPGDVDVFALSSRPIFGIEARVFFDPTIGAMSLRMIDASGSELAVGSKIDTPDVLRLRYAHDVTETLYLEVKSPEDAENNYDLQLFITE